MERTVCLLLGVASALAYNVPLGRAIHRAPARSAIITLQQAPADAVQIVSDETYGLMLSTLLKTNNSISSEISANYAMVDYGFLQRLYAPRTHAITKSRSCTHTLPNLFSRVCFIHHRDEAIAAPDDEAHLPRLTSIKEAVNAEMATRMQQAAEALKEVLTSPTPVIMEGKIAGFARQGRIDDAMLQLLEANLQQAQQAGEQGKGAVAVMSKLQERVKTELDQKLPAPIALLRRLMRMDDPMAREGLLREKMAPKTVSKIVLTDSQGKAEEPEDTAPEVSPRDVSAAILEIKSRFGNVDEAYDTGFVQKLEQIANEAEAVALDLAGGKELSSKQQQDLMWERGTVSVWDLEQIEEEAHQDGNFAVWEEEAQQQMQRQETASREQSILSDMGQ